MKNTQGITLITLVITVIILLILAGIAIATLTDENGILTKVNTSKEMTQEAEAKEILELSLISAVTQKFTTNEYNPNEWLNEYVIAENPNELITINEDIFIVNGWGFLVDRNVPKIVENLGKTSGIPKIASIKILSGDKQESGWYTSNIKIRIQGSGYKINGEDIKLENGIKEITISEDGIYEIIAYIKGEDETNISEQKETIKRDTTKPEDFKPVDGVGNGTGKQLEISSKAEDLSGISEYRYYLNNEHIKTTTEEKFILTGLQPFVEYELYVIAKDNVGQEKQSETIKFNTGIYLYKNGNEYTEVTGGWQKIYKIQHKATKRAKSSAVNLVKEDEYLGFYINGEGIATSTAVGYQCGATVGISNRLKIENYKYMNTKIAVGLYSYNSDSTCGMVMDGDGITYLAPTETEVDYGLIAYSNGTDTPKNFRWDILHFKGQYSPAIFLQSRENKLSWVDIYEVYLIK